MSCQENEGMDLFKSGDVYIYVFYDIHQNDTVTAVKLITTTLEQRKSGMYAGGDVSLRNGFEQQLFDLTNAARVRHGAPFCDGMMESPKRPASIASIWQSMIISAMKIYKGCRLLIG